MLELFIKVEGEVNSMRTVDLFAGSGGLSLGFENAGFDIVAAYDAWPPAIKCYKANFHHPMFDMDLSNVKASVSHISQWAPKIIIGGPPCQDFSHAGKRMEGERANLTLSFAKIVDAIRPQLFVMENVDRAFKSEAYARARRIFKKAGYGLTEKVVDASLCGVPQIRKRFFCIGCLREQDNFLDQKIEMSLSTRPMTVREYLGSELTINYYYRHPRNYNRRGVFSVDEPAPTIRGVNRPVPKGYPGHPNDASSVTRRLRALTTYERARLQSFPSNFIWPGSKTDVEQMIGNAVPIKLAEFVGRIVISYLKPVRTRRRLTVGSRTVLEMA